jgi:hypothetical protein
MTSPSQLTVKRLFAMSGNRCAFPECWTPIFDDDGTALGEICHIKASREGGPRYDRDQTQQARHGYENLILLCCNHHKAVDTQIQVYSIDVLVDMKALAEAQFSRAEHPSDDIFANALLSQVRNVSIVGNSGNVAIASPGAMQAQTIVLKPQTRKVTFAPPPGTVGSDANATRYAKYLIDRYRDFAKGEPSRTKAFSHSVIYKSIEREFGTSWKLVPVHRFDELCNYLQSRISSTRVGRLNRSKGQSLYSAFDEYLMKHG